VIGIFSFNDVRKKMGNNLYNESCWHLCVPHAKKRTEVNGLLELKAIYLREDTQIQEWGIC